MIKIYTDGACSVNPGIGGWGAIIIFDSGEEKEISGSELETTNNRMEITAVIKSLELKELNIEDKVKIYSDSTYVINTITKNWKRNANNDLWDKLDNLLEKRIVEWEWVKGHSGNKYNEIADKLAVNAINELKKNHPNTKLKDVKKALRIRNILDTKRKNSPLLRHPDSIEIDTGKLSKKAMLAKMIKYVEKVIKLKYGN